MSKDVVEMLCGLPGSGKTTYAAREVRRWRRKREEFDADRIAVVDFDAHLNGGRYPKDLSVIWKKFSERSWWLGHYEKVIIDGFFPTDEVRIRVLRSFLDAADGERRELAPERAARELRLVWWIPNRSRCLFNDSRRKRGVSAENTIKNARFEVPDAEAIKKALNADGVVRISSAVVVEKVPALANAYDQEFESATKDGKYLDGEPWISGGDERDCWGNVESAEPEDAREPVEFDDFVLKLAPKVSFAQYRKLRKACLRLETYQTRDYYGGAVERKMWRCDVRKLYRKMKEFGLLRG